MNKNPIVNRVISSVIAVTLCTVTTTMAADNKDVSDSKQTKATRTIQYVANMGVLITAGDKSVLIDALFRQGEAAYDSVNEHTRELMEVGKPPFQNVKIALATHVHKDHFAPQSVSRFMRVSPTAKFVSTSAAIARLGSGAVGFDDYRDRVQTIEPEEGSSVEFSNAGVSVDVLRLSHGGALFSGIVNLGFIVHIGGKRVLHVGDGVLNTTTIAAIEAAAVGVDVVCVPYLWLLSYDGQVLLKKKIKPKTIIALHFATGEAALQGKPVHRFFPNAVIMSKAGQTVPF